MSFFYYYVKPCLWLFEQLENILVAYSFPPTLHLVFVLFIIRDSPFLILLLFGWSFLSVPSPFKSNKFFPTNHFNFSPFVTLFISECPTGSTMAKIDFFFFSPLNNSSWPRGQAECNPSVLKRKKVEERANSGKEQRHQFSNLKLVLAPNFIPTFNPII